MKHHSERRNKRLMFTLKWTIGIMLFLAALCLIPPLRDFNVSYIFNPRVAATDSQQSPQPSPPSDPVATPAASSPATAISYVGREYRLENDGGGYKIAYQYTVGVKDGKVTTRTNKTRMGRRRDLKQTWHTIHGVRLGGYTYTGGKRVPSLSQP